MEAEVSSETLVSIYQNAQRNIQKQQSLANRHREKLNWHRRYYYYYCRLVRIQPYRLRSKKTFI
jgi:hypothetical protein